MRTNELTDRSTVSAPMLADITRAGASGVLSSQLIDRYGEHVKAIVYWLRKRGHPIFGRFDLDGYRYWASEELAGPSERVMRVRSGRVTVSPGVVISTRERDTTARLLEILDAAGSQPVQRAKMMEVAGSMVVWRCIWALRRDGKCHAMTVKRPALFWRHKADMMAQNAAPEKPRKPPKAAKAKPGPKPHPLRAMKSKIPPRTPPQGEVTYAPDYKVTSAVTPLPRFYVATPTPTFSGLRLGSYYADDSAVARAYGGGV